MADITNPTIVSEATKRLKKLDIDTLNSVAQLEEMLADHRYSLVPLLDYISRPDYVVEILVRGKIAIFLDGSPSAAGTMFFILLALEVFREAGVRLPKPVGGTVSVVGGLIIGQSAIGAGLTSPSMLVVAGVTGIASFTLVNQSLAGTVIFFRFIVFIFSYILVFFGFYVSLLILLVYGASLKSFNVPYIANFSPPTIFFRNVISISIW